MTPTAADDPPGPGSRPGPVGKIWVVGVPAAGKSTLSLFLAEWLELDHIELDGLFWGPGWIPRDTERFQGDVRRELDVPRWIVDGQYESAVAAFALESHVLIWIDPPLRRTFWRLSKRTVSRLMTGKRLWNGNRETVIRAFGPRSVIWYAIMVHRRQRRASQMLSRRLAARGIPTIRHTDIDPERVLAQLRDLSDVGTDFMRGEHQ